MELIGNITLAAVAVTCIFSVAYYITSQREDSKHSTSESETGKKLNNIVGDSHTRLGQNDYLQAKSLIPQKVEPSTVSEAKPYTTEEALLDIDVDMEESYSIEPEDDEELRLLTADESIHAIALGADFEALAEMSEVIQSHIEHLSSTHITKAAKTIETVENTDLFTQLVEQIEDGEQKVAAILDFCEAEMKASNETPNSDLDGFDLGEWV